MLSQSEFLQYSQSYSMIPLEIKIEKVSDFSPSMFLAEHKSAYSLLLESGEHEKEKGRYTYLAQNPMFSLQRKDGKFLITEGKKDNLKLVKRIINDEKLVQYDDSNKAIQSLLDFFYSPKLIDLPPFTGGAMGYFSYEWIKTVEKIPNEHQIKSAFADIHLAFFDEVIVFDHEQQEVYLIYNLFVVPNESNEVKVDKYHKIIDYLKQKAIMLEEILKKAQVKSNISKNISLDKRQQSVQKEFIQPFLPEQYMSAVRIIKQNIVEGEVFQTVLSQKLKTDTNVDPYLIYQVLREINPSPYMFYLQMNEEKIIGTSPETLVKVLNDKITTFPIAGTRPRGKTEAEDIELAQDLLADQKELAEHVMLIDLARNDLGKVSQAGTVKVEAKMKIERFSHVMHIVSKVTGQKKDDKSAIDVLKAIFPAGTVSGAPKVRAMEMIAKLEPEERGPYAGAVAALGFNGNIDTCITIRSMFFNGDNVTIQAGAGVVADSEPEKEYTETMNKAKAMLKAIELAESL